MVTTPYRVAGLAMFCGVLSVLPAQGQEPQLVLTSVQPAYGAAERPLLLMRLDHAATATKKWTITTFSPGSVRVVSLVRRTPGLRKGTFRSSAVDAEISMSCPETSMEAEALEGRRVIAPGESQRLILFVTRDPRSGGYALFTTHKDLRVFKMSPHLEQRHTYALLPGEYTLQVAYEPRTSSDDPNAPVVPKLLSNTITFRIQ